MWSDLIPVTPSIYLFPNTLITTGVAKVMNNPKALVQKELPTTCVFTNELVLNSVEGNHNAGREGLPRAHDMLSIFPVRVPSNVNSVSQVTFRDSHEVVEQDWLDNLI